MGSEQDQLEPSDELPFHTCVLLSGPFRNPKSSLCWWLHVRLASQPFRASTIRLPRVLHMPSDTGSYVDCSALVANFTSGFIKSLKSDAV